MRIALNVVWLLLAGWWLSLVWLLVGMALFISIVGIPFGAEAMKIAGFVLWPFGHVLVERQDGEERRLNAIANAVWIVLAGWWLALVHLVAGALLCVSVVGIPLGLGLFKMVPITFRPFGREIVPEDPEAPGRDGSVQMPVRWRLSSAH